ncbi:MAG: N-acetyl sugar amidotransferase [Ferruginibacter sp.]
MVPTKICNRCIMDDNGDSEFVLNNDGTCNYCTYALERMDNVYFPNEEGKDKLVSMLKTVKDQSKNSKYDCIMGISGGLDSAYLAYLGSKIWGLRILGVHIDDGFDSPIAKENIQNLTTNCGIELINEQIDQEQFNDLTRSFLVAGLPGICIPQDNVLVARLFQIAEEKKLSNFLSGTNFAAESILQRGGMHNASDKVHIKDVHNKYGLKSINKLPLLSLFDRYIKYKYIKKQNYLRPLDFIDYNVANSIEELKNVGFNYYEGKHYESILTRFLQVYYLPKKFNVDIRKSHISSLIISGQISRNEALEELKKPLYDEEKIQEDIDFILSKLKISRQEFESIMQERPRNHLDFKYSKLIKYTGLARKYRKHLSD